MKEGGWKMRLIDADALYDVMNNSCGIDEIDDALWYVDDAPTVDAVPVRHGRWEWDKDGMDWGIGAWKCSECKSRPNTYWATEQRNPLISASSKFCGNCGAKMDKEDGND